MISVKYEYEEIDSTQNEARRNFRVFEDQPDALLIISAKRQTAGRGREQRSWVSTDDCVCLTFAFLLNRPSAEAGSIGAVLAISADSAISNICGTRIDGIKWPNDLILGGLKVGGVLAELASHREMLVVVAGVGINVKVDARKLPERAIWPAGSLWDFFPSSNVKAKSIEDAVICEFLKNANIWNTKGFRFFKEIFISRLIGIGEQTKIGAESGESVGVSDEGFLLLRNSAGKIQKITAGEILAD